MQAQPNMNVKGACNCGSVTFSVGTSVSDVYVCHCSICRKSTGSGGIAVTVVPTDDFAWLEGAALVNTWHKPGHDWETSFCSRCGSPLPGKNDDNTTYIPVSLLDSGHENLRVQHHICVDSKAAWEEIADNARQHKNGFSE